jgi:hypothetical protein
MPIMPRIKGKAKKIAYSILGVPANLKRDSNKKSVEVQRTLEYQNTMRIK